MSSNFAYNPRRPRNPFLPYDDSQAAAADQGVYSPAPDLGGGGQPEQPQMFTPPPTSVFQPPQDKLAEANSILQGGGRRSAFAPAPSSNDFSDVHPDVSSASFHSVQNALSPPPDVNADRSSPSFPTPRGSVFSPPAGKSAAASFDPGDSRNAFSPPSNTAQPYHVVGPNNEPRMQTHNLVTGQRAREWRGGECRPARGASAGGGGGGGGGGEAGEWRARKSSRASGPSAGGSGGRGA